MNKRIGKLPKKAELIIIAVVILIITVSSIIGSNIVKQINGNVGQTIERLEEVTHQTEVPEGYVAIRTMEDIKEILKDTANFSKNYILMNDINWSGLGMGDTNHTIGTSSNPFSGTFDGNNYTIKGYSLNEIVTNYHGLFGIIGTEGKVCNLTLDNSTVYGLSYVGGLVGRNYGTITNVHVKGTVIVQNSEQKYVGGLAGANGGSIENCSSEVNVTNAGSITGGLVGWNQGGGTITKSYSTGTVIGEKEYTGGLVGWNIDTITASYSTGKVTGPQEYLGGLVGYNSGTITKVYSTSDVMVKNDSSEKYSGSVGGLVGKNGRIIENAYSTGKVEIYSNAKNASLGGLVGENAGTIKNTYTISYVTYTRDNDSGRLIGYTNEGTTITDSYWIPASNLNKSAGGTKKSRNELLYRDSYGLNWDFDTIWAIEPNGGSLAYLRDLPIPAEFKTDMKTSITVNKVWVDTETQRDKRPATITIQIKTGDTVIQSYEMNSTTETSHTFTNLPKYDASGNEIVYTVAEVMDSKFYVSSIEGNTITNTFTVPDDVVQATINKVWVDTEAQRDKRPETITIQIKSGDTVVQSYEMNSTTETSHTFTNLPKYDANGNEVVYTVSELTDSKFYTSSIEGNTITNTFVVPSDVINVPVEKVWVDNQNTAGKRPANVTIQLKQNEANYGEAVTLTGEMNAEKWNYTYENLPKYDANGNEYAYTVEETSTHQFYVGTVTGNMSKYTITNTYTVPDEKIEITINKVWVDTEAQRDKRPGTITIQIKTGDTVVQGYEMNSTTETSHTFTNLPKYDASGNEIVYTVAEVMDSNFYTSSIEGNTITNTFAVPDDVINVPIEKVWVDNQNTAGKRPANVTIQLKQNEANYGEAVTLTGETNAEKWNYTYENLPKYDANGNEYVYTVEETSTHQFYVGTVTGNMTKYVVTNTFTISDERIELSVNKVWVDTEAQRDKRPGTITIQIKTGDTVVQSYEMNTTTETSHTFTNLPKYDASGNEYVYTVAEVMDSKFYTSSIEGNTITNTFVVPSDVINVPIEKVWLDNQNTAGKRPANVTIQLKQNEANYGEAVTLTGETNAEKWNYTYENLPKYDANGNEYVYTVEETSTHQFYVGTVTGNMTKYVVTNTFTVSDERIELTVNKVWVDTEAQRDKRPGTITIQIKTGDTVVQSYEMNTTTETSHTFTNLPKYDASGNEYVYTVAEVMDSKFYTSSIEGNTITNTFTVPSDVVQATIYKVWVDTEEQKQERPETITIQIKSGDTVVQSYEMNSTTETSHTFTNLPKYDANGNEMAYTVAEVMDSEVYVSSIEGNTITNTYIKAEGKIQVAIQKVDKETKHGLKGATITLIGDTQISGITDEDGYAVFEVERGKEYSYKEAIAPNGYEINTNIYSFKVTQEGIIEDINGNRIIEDEKIKEKPIDPVDPVDPVDPIDPENPVDPIEPEKPDNLSPTLPQTGENITVVLILAVMITCTSITAIYFYKKKSSKNSYNSIL